MGKASREKKEKREAQEECIKKEKTRARPCPSCGQAITIALSAKTLPEEGALIAEFWMGDFIKLIVSHIHESSTLHSCPYCKIDLALEIAITGQMKEEEVDVLRKAWVGQTMILVTLGTSISSLTEGRGDGSMIISPEGVVGGSGGETLH